MNSFLALKQRLESLGYRAELPPPEVAADLAIPCFTHDPHAVATVLENMHEPLIDQVTIAGRYVNIAINASRLAIALIPLIEREPRYGSGDHGAGKKVLVEFSDPNVAKPLNVGHFRSTMIGQALANLYRWAGYDVVTINHLGDWGTQFGKLLIAHERWGSEEKDLFRLYVRFHEEAEKNPALEQEARDAFTRLERGDQRLHALWKKITDDSIADFQTTYAELGVMFDHITGESFYQDKVAAAVQEALEKGVAVVSEGATVVPEEKTGLPTFVIQKNDDSSIYGGRDLATAKYRFATWNPEKVLYVVGSEQTLYFRQVFTTLALMGYDTSRLVHISLGLVVLPEGKMSTRKGKVILLRDLLTEALQRTQGDKTIAYGALIYNAIASRPQESITFRWEQALSTEGASAPYIQYGGVRAKSILAKVGLRENFAEPSHLDTHERQLILALALFPWHCVQAQQQNAPHLLAHYLHSLVQVFNRFYGESSVTNADETTRRFRAHLVAAFLRVIENGLSLLNIQLPDRM